MTFLRRVWHRHSKLGKGRKKKQVWRRPTGRDNKMREKRKGLPALVSIGYGKKKSERKEIFVLKNLKDFEKSGKNIIFVVGNVGKKKKEEIVKKAKEMKINLQNINVNKFLKSISNEKNKPVPITAGVKEKKTK